MIQIDGGSVAGDDRAHSAMQASLDELARMRDLVSRGTLPGGATALIEQIRGFVGESRRPRRGGSPPAAAPPPRACPPGAAALRPATAVAPALRSYATRCGAAQVGASIAR